MSAAAASHSSRTSPSTIRPDYLIFYGNAFAELPNYATDLQTRGDAWRLEIENAFFVARLSEQMGQLKESYPNANTVWNSMQVVRATVSRQRSIGPTTT